MNIIKHNNFTVHVVLKISVWNGVSANELHFVEITIYSTSGVQYRAISILKAAQIIFRRLSINYYFGCYQAGFTDRRSTTAQIFAVQILQKYRELPTRIMYKYGFPGSSQNL